MIGFYGLTISSNKFLYWVIQKRKKSIKVLCNKLQKTIGTQHDKLRQSIKTITFRLYHY